MSAEIVSHEGVEAGFIEAPESGDFSRLLAIRLRKILLQLSTGPVKRAANKALGVVRSFTLDDNFFLVRMDRLTPKEKEYLRAMADWVPGPTAPATSLRSSVSRSSRWPLVARASSRKG